MIKNWVEVRCKNDATYRTGPCDTLFFTVTSTGGISHKCSSCKKPTMIHKSEWQAWITEDSLSPT